MKCLCLKKSSLRYDRYQRVSSLIALLLFRWRPQQQDYGAEGHRLLAGLHKQMLVSQPINCSLLTLLDRCLTSDRMFSVFIIFNRINVNPCVTAFHISRLLSLPAPIVIAHGLSMAEALKRNSMLTASHHRSVHSMEARTGVRLR